MTFERPAPLAVYFAVSIANGPLVPADAVTQVQAAIINAFAGADGGPRARIGSTIYASRFIGPVAALGPWAQIISLLVGSNNTAGTASFTGVIAGTALTVSSVTGTIAIGQVLSGANVVEGTTIVSGSGTSWVVSNNHSAVSEAMKSTTVNQNSVVVNINQVPVTSALDIQVVLV